MGLTSRRWARVTRCDLVPGSHLRIVIADKVGLADMVIHPTATFVDRCTPPSGSSRPRSTKTTHQPGAT
jgi:hypothetical protein